MIEFFGRGKLEYTNDNLIQLHDDLSKEDKQNFSLDVKGIDWYNYSLDMYFGARKFLLKEKKIDIQRDRMRMKA